MIARRLTSVVLAAVLVGAGLECSAAESTSWLAGLFSPELWRIEKQRTALEKELAALGTPVVGQTAEQFGYQHPRLDATPLNPGWVEVDLRSAQTIDWIALVPAQLEWQALDRPAYGFPKRFRVDISDDAEFLAFTTVANYTESDFPDPGVAPVGVAVSGQRARYVRVTVTKFALENGQYFFALGEVMIFQGPHNIAARLKRVDRRVSRTTGAVPVWGTVNLADGHTVLGPPVGLQPSPTLGYQSKLVNLNKEPNPASRWVQVDLGEAVPVDEVRVFPAHPPEFAHRPGFGFPLEWKVELSNDAEFGEAIALRDFDEDVPFGLRQSVNPGDNVASFFSRGESARYVRFTALQLFNANGQYNLALAEMQVWSKGKNVALGRPVTAFDSMENKGWSKAALVDGFNSEANILDWPEWLAGLSSRREAEQRIAALDVRRGTILQRLQKLGWWMLVGLAVTLLLTFLGYLWLQRRARRAEMEALRQRIARDLHDEIGSSLGSIALISHDVMAVADDPAQVRRELAEIQGIARQTVDSMRDIARLVQTEAYTQGDLAGHLREIADRMLRNLPHDLRLESGSVTAKVAVDRQRDLVLIFKEALHNILKHAQATHVGVVLTQVRGLLTLTIQDNGRGFDPAGSSNGGMGLTNLRRRAEKHGGEVRIASTVGAGSIVTICLPVHE